MSIVHIVPNLGWGGVESVVSDLSIALKNKGQDVHIISLFRNYNAQIEKKAYEYLQINGVKVHYLYDRNNKRYLDVFYRLRKKLKEIREKNPLILNLHLKWGVLAGVVGSIGLGNLIRVETYHSNYLRYKLQAFLMKPFIDGYIAVSHDAANELRNKFNINKNKVITIYNGVNSKEIKTHENKFAIMDNIIFLSTGRLSVEKGFEYSVKAFDKLRKKKNNVLYKLIGDGPLKENITSLLSDSRFILEGHITREKLIKEIYKANIIIMPSLWEGNSIFLLEVLTVGRPVIISDIPSFRETFKLQPLKNELFRPFECGVLVKSKDEKSIAAGMNYLCENTDKLIYMCKNAYDLSKTFDINNTSDSYIDFYKEIARGKIINDSM